MLYSSGLHTAILNNLSVCLIQDIVSIPNISFVNINGLHSEQQVFFAVNSSSGPLNCLR